jgi:hypothetical protein
VKYLVSFVAVLAVAAGLATSAAAVPRGGAVWEYPYLCFSYQAGEWAWLNGQYYVCQYVGPYSPTGFAFVPH